MRDLVVVGVLVVALAGCGGVGAGGEASPSPSRSSGLERSTEPEPFEHVPVRDREAFLAELGRADPGLVDGEPQRKRGLRRAVYTCRDMGRESLSDTRLAILISQRFTGGHGEVSIAEGRRLGPVIQERICPHL
ncbi:hypothetical protein [Actinomadura sp. 21ATH]|uniref:hypothetical protein n=1 Tax=Actinomadura sp. 21ATH TaxID=1735444 RepID=UPI0035BFFB5A